MGDQDDWLNTLVRRAAQEAVGGRQFKGTLVCTGFKPKGHLIKGMLVPHGIETGWIQAAAIHAGNGYGVVIGPKVGDAQKLDGDQFDVEFDFGDPNTITARHRLHSNQDVPPEVQSGEMMFRHESGNQVFFDKDKTLTVKHHTGTLFQLKEDKSATILHADGQTVKIDGDGNITVDSKDKTTTVAATSGGSVNINATSIALTGTATLNGQPIATL